MIYTVFMPSQDYYNKRPNSASRHQHQQLQLSRRTHAARRAYMTSQDSRSFDREMLGLKPSASERRKSNDNFNDNGFPSKPARKQNPIIAVIRRKSIVWFLLTIVCIVGLILQLENIIELYFEYETVSELSIDVPTNITAPAMSLCIPYTEIIDREKLTEIMPHTENETILLLSDVQHLTLSQMFLSVPMPAGLLKVCIYRAPYSYARFTGSEDCEDVFTVERYYKQQYVCYSFRMREMERAQFAFDYIQNSMRNPGTL